MCKSRRIRIRRIQKSRNGNGSSRSRRSRPTPEVTVTAQPRRKVSNHVEDSVRTREGVLAETRRFSWSSSRRKGLSQEVEPSQSVNAESHRQAKS